MEATTAPATAATTLAEAFQLTVERHPERVALRTQGGATTLTWAQYGARVERIAAGLAQLGIGRHASVALMLSNRPEFHLCDAAALVLGATPFSIYNTYPAEQVAHLLRDAASNVLITERAMLDTARDAAQRAGVGHLIVIDTADSEDVTTLSELEEIGDDRFDLESALRAVSPDDLATIIYTSGTTGPPKGVELTHANVLATLRAYFQVVEFPDEGRVVSWLPMAHIAERACSHYLPILRGYTTTCCPDPREVVAYLPEVRPTWFFAVPRIWEKVKAGLESQGVTDPAALPEETKAGIRERLGLDEVRSVNVGAAPCPATVIEFFHALGVPLAELYGMSESCGGGCVNPPGGVKIGTVGPPLPGVEARLADDNEILLRGPMVMSGYRNAPDQTREAIDDDGWLHTGDIGEFDEDGYLRIVDRKKELIINAAGKNMSPANIEATIKSASPVIGNVVAIGDQRPYNVALITVDAEVAPRLGDDRAVAAAVQAAVDAGNKQLARVEQIKRFKILAGDWQPGGDELTPTAKLKRNPIAEKYAREIEELYTP